jgi:hypothetical protein
VAEGLARQSEPELRRPAQRQCPAARFCRMCHAVSARTADGGRIVS